MNVILCSYYMYAEQYWWCGTSVAGAVVVGAVFWWQITLTVFEPVRPIGFMLFEMAMCVQHSSSISEVVAVNFRARSL